MRRLILTSAGFDNKRIEKKFLELVGLPSNEIKVMFVPTAAITKEQKEIIPLCKKELIDAGVSEENIFIYDLDRTITSKEISNFHAIYVCGGSTKHLLNKMNEFRFDIPLMDFLDNGGVYVGVSAGSIVLAKNFPSSLGYLNCILKVHSNEGISYGDIDTTNCPEIKLADNQAILIIGDKTTILE